MKTWKKWNASLQSYLHSCAAAQVRPCIVLGLYILCFELSCGYFYRAVKTSLKFGTLLGVLWLSLQVGLHCWFIEKLLKQQKDGYHVSLDGKALAYVVINLNRTFISVHQSRFFFSSWVYSLMPIQVQILLYFFKLSAIICVTGLSIHLISM